MCCSIAIVCKKCKAKQPMSTSQQTKCAKCGRAARSINFHNKGLLRPPTGYTDIPLSDDGTPAKVCVNCYMRCKRAMDKFHALSQAINIARGEQTNSSVSTPIAPTSTMPSFVVSMDSALLIKYLSLIPCSTCCGKTRFVYVARARCATGFNFDCCDCKRRHYYAADPSAPVHFNKEKRGRGFKKDAM